MSQCVKDIDEKRISNSTFGVENDDVSTTRLTFGKHKFSTFDYVFKTDKRYCVDFINNFGINQSFLNHCETKFYNYDNETKKKIRGNYEK